MERYLPSHDKIHTGRFYHVYRFTPRLLNARRIMALHYSGTKLFMALVSSFIMIFISLFLCRRFSIDSALFFIGFVGFITGTMWIIQALFRFFRLYLNEPQGKWIRKEHHKLAPAYIGESSTELFYMNFFADLDREYNDILLPVGLSDEERSAILCSSFYRRVKRYTKSLRFMGFTIKERQIFLAAVSEIISDKVLNDEWDFFSHENSFWG